MSSIKKIPNSNPTGPASNLEDRASIDFHRQKISELILSHPKNTQKAAMILANWMNLPARSKALPKKAG